MKTTPFIALLAFLACSSLQASNRNPGTIRLRISDSGQPLSAPAFVQLFNAKDSSIVQTALTESNGTATFTGLSCQRYFISVEQVNCKPLKSAAVELPCENPHTDMGVVHLESYGPPSSRIIP